ncbi:MAG: acyl-CoA thioesterase [Proteobacteria bacterium]|nr:acyl-CoA thioesterase [Pseudomonadota bacterium]
MRKRGVLPVEVEVEVPFHDVDLARIAWHGHYAKYLENARWALMDRLGHGLDVMIAAGEGWPIVELQVKYLRVSRYRDRLRVRAELIEWESRLVINYLITDVATGERVARAQTTQVVVDMPDGTLRFALPAAFVARVAAELGRGTGGGDG